MMFGALVTALASSASAAGMMAVTKIAGPGDMSLQVIDKAASCKNGPGAFVFDANGKKIDQTCNVKISPKGVSVLFPGYGKRVFFPKDQFVLTPAP